MEKHSPHYLLAKIQAQMNTVQEMNLTVSAKTPASGRWAWHRLIPWP